MIFNLVVGMGCLFCGTVSAIFSKPNFLTYFNFFMAGANLMIVIVGLIK